MVEGGGTFGRELDHEEEALMNGISALIRRDTGEKISLGHMRTQQKGGRLQTRKRVPTRNQISQHLDLVCPASRTVRNVCHLRQPVYGIFIGPQDG